MQYIFLDESGDLGFSKRSSKWFVFTILLCPNKRQLEKIIKKIHRSLRKKYRNISELHAYHSDKITRKRVLKSIAEVNDLHVFCIVLNKEKVYVDLQNQKNYLYNFTVNILLDRLHSHDFVGVDDNFDMYIDRKDTKKNLRDNFEKYLKNSLNSKRNGQISITLKASHEEKALQAVDFVSWAIFRKYERGDYEYYDIIENKIVEEKLLFS